MHCGAEVTESSNNKQHHLLLEWIRFNNLWLRYIQKTKSKHLFPHENIVSGLELFKNTKQT
jgi:hypothetical protein